MPPVTHALNPTKNPCQKCNRMLRFGRQISWLAATCWCIAGNWVGNTSLVADDQLAAALTRPLTATWQGRELAAVLARIAATQHVEICLDRRVDPQQTIDVKIQDLPLADVLNKLTESRSLGWVELDNFIYVGPSDSARDLPTLTAIARNSLAKVSAKDRKPWLTESSVAWPRLSEPRAVLNEWLMSAGIELDNPEAIPHDLWNAKELPSMSLIDRVVLLLAGFDQTCQISNNGKSCKIVPIERPVLLTREYRPGNQMREFVQQLQDIAGVSINRSGSNIAVTGRVEDHERIKQLLEGNTPPKKELPKPKGRRSAQVFSLRLENQPVGKVIAQLAAQLGLEVVWNSALSADLQTKLVSCDVVDGDLPTLLGAILSPVGLAFELNEKRLEILPAN